jgi:plastocyanin
MIMKTKMMYCAVLLVASVFLLSSCGKSSNSSTNPTSNSATPAAAASVSIENFAFSPATVHVTTGGTVTWTNKDATAHTATDVNGNFDSGNLNPTQTFKFTFSTPGTYTYRCTIHSMMAKATVVVGN